MLETAAIRRKGMTRAAAKIEDFPVTWRSTAGVYECQALGLYIGSTCNHTYEACRTSEELAH